MTKALLVSLMISLVAFSAVRAQNADAAVREQPASQPAPQSPPSPIGFRFTYATGFTVANEQPMGLSLSLGAETATPFPALRLRFEGMFQQDQVRDIFGMASVELLPLGPTSPFYGLAGLGFHLDDGIVPSWSAGAGVDLGKVTRLPFFLEYRLFFARTQFSSLSFGVHFPAR